MTFTGTIANINSALSGMTFAPTSGFDGAAALQITTDDQGNSGNGGTRSDTDSVSITVQDGGILAFSSATFTVAENDGTATVTVSRTGGTAGEARVNYATSNGTATAGQDYTAASGTLTFDDGVATRSFTVPINNDTTDEVNETASLSLSSIAGNGSLGTQASATLTITDNDAAPTVSINDVSLNEGNSGTNPATFTVTLAAVSAKTVTVEFATADGEAKAASDYQANTGTLTFAPGDTTKTVNVLVNGDATFEADEDFTVELTDVRHGADSSFANLGFRAQFAAAFQMLEKHSLKEHATLQISRSMTRGGVAMPMTWDEWEVLHYAEKARHQSVTSTRPSADYSPDVSTHVRCG